MSDSTKPALPEPDGYFYEVDGYFGIHRQFDTAPYNGMRPHRTVGYFTADTTRAAIDAAVAEARAVPEGWQSVIQSVLHNNGGPIDAGSTVDGKDYVMVLRSDFDALAALAATPSPAEQPKPAVVDLPDSIRVPLHRLWADAGYLIGRAKNGETDLAVHTIKALCDELERAIRAALQGANP